MNSNIYAILLVYLTLCGHCTANDSWVAFRGDGSGAVNANPPERWSPDNGVAWQSEIPGYGQSSPVVWGQHVYLTSTEGPFQTNCQVHAFDLETGNKLWTSDVAATTKVENYFRNSRAAPTCCVDDSAVYSFFASGDVTAMKHSGETLWSTPVVKRFGEVDNERGVASSLAQTSDNLFVLVDHHGPSYLVSINKSDGNVAWKADRGERVPS